MTETPAGSGAADDATTSPEQGEVTEVTEVEDADRSAEAQQRGDSADAD